MYAVPEQGLCSEFFLVSPHTLYSKSLTGDLPVEPDKPALPGCGLG